MQSVYLDWCPRATHSIGPVPYKYVNPQLLAELHAHLRSNRVTPDLLNEHVKTITCVYRTDGLFIFAIDWKTDPLNVSEEYNIAGATAHFIKTKLGHVHLFDRERASIVRDESWSPIQKFPVRVKLVADDGTPLPPLTQDQLATYLADDAKLLKLPSPNIPFSESHREDAAELPAVLRLREKYSRMFDKTFNWIQFVKTTEFMGLAIYRRYTFYTALFLAMVFASTVHSVSAAHSSDSQEVGWTLLAGLANTFCLGIAITAFIVAWKKWGPVFNIADHAKRILKPEAFRTAWKKAPRLRVRPRRAEVLLAAILVGPLLLSIREVPTAFGLWKLAKINYMDDLIKKLEHHIQFSSFKAAFAAPEFTSRLFGDLIFYTPLFLIIIYALDVSWKRRRIIRALTQLCGALQFANILNAVIDGAYYRADVGGRRKDFDFSAAANIAQMELAIELRKRLQVQAPLALLFMTCIYLSRNEYARFLAVAVF